MNAREGPTRDSRNPSARGTRPKRGPGPRPGDAHQREEVGVTVLEAGAVGGGVGVPVAVAVGRVAHGDEGLLGAVGGADSAAGRVLDNSILR